MAKEDSTMDDLTQKYPTLYRRDTSGRIRLWWMEQTGPQYVTCHGLEGGSIVRTDPTLAVAKSQATAQQQAAFEITAQYKTQREVKLYHDSREDVDKADAYFKPMLAQKYDWKKRIMSTASGCLGTVYIQPKLDGVRCIAKADGLWTRKGKPITSCPHIVDELRPFFSAHPDAVLDGELYNHALKDDFDRLSGRIRKSSAKLTVAEQDEIVRLVQFHVYDYPSQPTTFGQRCLALYGEFYTGGLMMTSPAIQYVQTHDITSQGQGDELHGKFIADGYEGSVFRLDELYGHEADSDNRSYALLKRKDFDDAEFTLLRLEPGIGNWANKAKRGILVDSRGEEFEAGLRGDMTRAKQLLEEGHENEIVTVRYFGLTPKRGVPRFGVITKFHGKERVL